MASRPDNAAPLEVLVAGGGPVGLTLALALARRDIRVGLVDARSLREPAPEEPRGWLAAYGCWRIFHALGLGEEVDALAQPVRRIENSGGGGHIAFDVDDAGSHAPALGFMIEAADLSSVLSRAVLAEARISVVAPARILSARFGDPHAEVETDCGLVRASLVAACDGVRSVLRTEGGIRFEGSDPGVKAVSAFVRLAHPHDGAARQTFLREGPMAILPLPGDRANLVWSVQAPIADALAAMTPPEFDREVARAAEGFVAGVQSEGRAIAFPVGVRVAERFHAARLALVGDAAHQVPPLAGQGLNLGLKDVAALVDVVTDAIRLGLDPGSLAQLAPYTSWRRPDAVATAAAMTGLSHAFSGPRALRAAAGVGMSLTGRADFARKLLAREAGADTGDLPSLMAATAEA